MIAIEPYSVTDPKERRFWSLLHFGGESDKPLLHYIRCTTPLHPPILLLESFVTSRQSLVFLNHLQTILDSSIWLSLFVGLSG